MMVPMVVESTSRGERSYDVYSLLLKHRIVFINSDIENAMASNIAAQLMYLESEDPTKDINIYINSNGGSIQAGLVITQIMDYIACDCSTTILSTAASFGSMIASCGTKGKRYILQKSKHMLHQCSSSNAGNILDMKVAMAETDRINEMMLDMYVQNTGQPREKLRADMNRDFYLTAEESVAYGLADHILTKRPALV